MLLEPNPVSMNLS